MSSEECKEQDGVQQMTTSAMKRRERGPVLFGSAEPSGGLCEKPRTMGTCAGGPRAGRVRRSHRADISPEIPNMPGFEPRQ